MLNYIENHLCAGETVVSKARRSRLLMVPHILAAAVLMMIGVSVNDSSVMSLCALISAGLVVCKWINEIKRYELAVTNRKIAGKKGLIRKTVRECPLERIDTVTIRKGLLGAILGYGTVVVTAVNGTFEFDHIVRPDEFKNDVLNAISGSKEESALMQARMMAEALRAAALR